MIIMAGIGYIIIIIMAEDFSVPMPILCNSGGNISCMYRG